jgi:diguanylate cyclase (GGDEF)-like protein/PAS domain S-box-containing protein
LRNRRADIAARLGSLLRRGGGGLLLALALGGGAEAARRDFYFQHISSREGLAQNSIHAILQDDTGFIWVATQGGLHRYDGYGFTLFQHEPADPGSLPESFVTALALGPGQQLWVGSNARFLARLDLASRRVQRFTEAARVDDPRRNAIAALRVDERGELWLGSNAGIEHFDPATGTRTEILRLANEARIDRAGMPRSIDFQFDRVGMLWAATDGGLFRIDPRSRTYQRVGPEQPAFGMLRDASGQLWTGTLEGLWRIDASGEVSPATDAQGRSLGAVWRLASDSRGRLWIALLAGGLLRYDPNDRSVLRIDYQPDLPAGLPERSLASLLVDRGDLLWVGGESNGLATTPTDDPRFVLYTDPARGGDRVGSNNVRALLQTADGAVWVGAEHEGLHRLDLERGGFDNHIAAIVAAIGEPLRGRGPRVLGLAAGEAGRIWVSTDFGAFDFDPATRSARRVVPNDLPPGATGSHFRAALRGRDGSLWLGSYADGVLRRHPDGRWQWYRHDAADPGSLSHGFVNHVYEDRRGLIWASTLDGLNRIDPASGRVQRIAADPEDPNALSGALVRGVLEGRDGRFWVATHSGLNVTAGDPYAERPRFERYTVADGLPSNTVYAVLQDAAGMIWASSNLGLVRVDPATREVRRFGVSDGLQDLEFNGGALLHLADGRLAFGGIRGLNVFDPARVQDSRFEPPVALTGLRIGGAPHNQAPLAPPSALQLPQAERVFRLRFAALDFTAPQRNRFEYRLEGFDAGWTDAGSSPDVTYTNLDAGRYLLRVRATNHDGIWSSRELRLPVAVVPPWWASRVAQAGYLLAAGLGLLLLLRLQQRRRRQERALIAEVQEREERLKLALWGSGDEFWDWDFKRNAVVRMGADQLLGRDETQEQLSTDEWRRNAVHPDDLPRVQETLQAHITGRSPAFESEHRIRNARGEWIWVRSRGKVVARDADGHAIRMAGTARDITASRQAEGERRIASEVLRSMGEAVAVVDLGFCFVSVNPAFTRITGYSEDDVRGVSAGLLDSPQQPPEFYRRLREGVERSGHWKGELWQRRKDGEEFLSWLEISEVRDPQGQRTHFVAVISDITDKKRAEQELRYLANYDTLTGLPNRTLLSERLARAVVRARRNETRIAVLFLDLDRFKDINDSLGHSAGDRILKSAAARLLATVRESDTVARLGGDEFTVVLEDIHEPGAAEQMAARIVESFKAPLDLDGRSEVAISPSIGIALFPDHAQVPIDLLKYADTAMYAAKERGRNTWQLYNEAMDSETRRRTAMLTALRRALERNEFSLVFQPRMTLHDGRITGFETLLRWDSPELGPVPPTSFIPLAEETGLILPIGEWVLHEAARTLARLHAAGHAQLMMSVNVSVLQFLRGRLDEQIRAAVAGSGVPAQLLELEVTESMVMANAEQTIRVLQGLKSLGVSIAIDDFGTGYSSLVYLKRLPIDTLKIDKEFVGDLTSDPDDEAITATIITMAHSLGLRVVAEGVESAEQLDYLREHRCDEIQGYWLSRPMREADCLAFLRQHGAAVG